MEENFVRKFIRSKPNECLQIIEKIITEKIKVPLFVAEIMLNYEPNIIAIKKKGAKSFFNLIETKPNSKIILQYGHYLIYICKNNLPDGNYSNIIQIVFDSRIINLYKVLKSKFIPYINHDVIKAHLQNHYIIKDLLKTDFNIFTQEMLTTIYKFNNKSYNTIIDKNQK